MIDVCCAIIENNGKILATKRGDNMHLSGFWEFPGGKIEPGENAEECIIREILEELNINIVILNKLTDVEHHYPEKSIRLIPFICKILSGNITLQDHSEFRWISIQTWNQLNWAPADIKVIGYYLENS